MIIATTVTVVQLLMNAYTYQLYQSLGIFIPLIVTNCIVIGRAEAFASKNSISHSAWDGFSMGLGMLLGLVALGGIRESSVTVHYSTALKTYWVIGRNSCELSFSIATVTCYLPFFHQERLLD